MSVRPTAVIAAMATMPATLMAGPAASASCPAAGNALVSELDIGNATARRR
jgi:hypothetical protein